MPAKLFRITIGMLLLSMAACVTVNIYFPAAKVEKTAQSIVDDVYGTQKNSTDKPQQTEQDQSSSLDRFLALITVRTAQAAELSDQELKSLKQSNSAIRGLKHSIIQNHKQLEPYYSSGNIGISNKGYLVLYSKKGLNIKEMAKLRRIIKEDNANRRKLYEEVAASMNIPGSEIAKVKDIFTRVWQKRAPAGWIIQDQAGNWHKK
ncbi:DUF1318 domain-containing protein [Maridesulfovibrio bastinii]|uniref:DUF1318 domain-containing protein n=1 Tax=Maridesulfovibrio bastinii TaxID=47157 RepID=UPI0003F9ECB1|nr:DUF1318 domain-containing protein [Maridesulfovibrio bastinii]